METFNNSVKRTVQKTLFSKFKTIGNFTGLAGPSFEEYDALARKYFKGKIVLVDNEVISPKILNRDITEVPATRIMDCDFCRTYVESGEALKYIFNKMDLNFLHNKTLLFTLSIRYVGLDNTLDWLNVNFYNKSLTNVKGTPTISLSDKGYIKFLLHKQNRFKDSLLIQYRNKNNTHMLSGGIKW